jgi:hypothetical protein
LCGRGGVPACRFISSRPPAVLPMLELYQKVIAIGGSTMTAKQNAMYQPRTVGSPSVVSRVLILSLRFPQS